MDFPKFELVTIILLLTLIVVIFIDELFRRRRWSKFPYRLPSLPVIGSLHCIIGRKDCFAMYLEWFNKFHAPFYGRAFYEEYYLTMDSEEIRKFLLASDYLNKASPYQFFKPAMLNSILIAEKDVWKPKRRFFSKAFNQMRLNKLLPQINAISDEVVEALASRQNRQFKEVFAKTILGGTMGTLLGCDEAIMRHPFIKKLDMYMYLKLLFEGTVHRYVKPWLYFDIIYFRTSDGKELVKKARDCSNAISYIMKTRREDIKNRKVEDRDKDLITIAVEENLNEEEVVSDMVTFLFASTESSAITMGLALTLLGMHKNFQEELYKEVIDVLGDSDYVDHEHLAKLKFTEMVLNETLRLFPSFPFVGRKIESDLNLGDRIVPKGTNVIACIYGVHRSEKYWENPLEFNPYRFLPQEVEKRGATTFMPFSVGPRNCIGCIDVTSEPWIFNGPMSGQVNLFIEKGAKYGMTVLKTTLAKIIRSYEVSSIFTNIDQIKIFAYISLDIENIDCTLTPRSTC